MPSVLLEFDILASVHPMSRPSKDSGCTEDELSNSNAEPEGTAHESHMNSPKRISFSYSGNRLPNHSFVHSFKAGLISPSLVSTNIVDTSWWTMTTTMGREGEVTLPQRNEGGPDQRGRVYRGSENGCLKCGATEHFWGWSTLRAILLHPCNFANKLHVE